MTDLPRITITRRLAVGATLGALALSGCAATSDGTTTGTSGVSSAAQEVADGTGVWDASAVHEFSIDVDEDALAGMIDTYQQTQEKEWIEATVTIDGTTYRRAGLRLKGNSSLRGVSDDAAPGDLPWLIRLDKFVDGQSVDGSSGFIVRSNSSETALNEAVASTCWPRPAWRASTPSLRRSASTAATPGSGWSCRTSTRTGRRRTSRPTACSTSRRPAATGRGAATTRTPTPTSSTRRPATTT